MSFVVVFSLSVIVFAQINNINDDEDQLDQVTSQSLPPVVHTPDESLRRGASSENTLWLSQNIILDTLRYSPSEAAQEILNNMEFYLGDNFEPNEDWIRANTKDLTPYGDFFVTHDPYTNTSIAYDSITKNPIDINLYEIDMLTKAKIQILTDPYSVFPSREELKEHFGLPELPDFSMSMPFSDEERNAPNPFSIANRERVAVPATGRYLGIVFVEAQFPDSNLWRVSTGFLINANTVVTSGHNLFNPSRGGWATAVRVTPGRNASNTPHDRITAQTYLVSGTWHSGQNSNYDWGAIRLNQNTNLVHANFWSMTTRTDVQLGNIDISLTGYPGDDSANPYGGMFRSRGQITALPANTNFVNTNAFGSTGISGGPVYSTAGIALAVVRGSVTGPMGNTQAVRITQHMMNVIIGHQWP